VSAAILSALLNLLILAGFPFLIYFVYHWWRKQRSTGEIAQRAGLRLGKLEFAGYGLAAALVVVFALVVWPPPLEPMTREGSAQRAFAGLGFGVRSIFLALLYGVIKTGFAEEFLFRGLIAGSLSRRLPILWANLLQALIFLLPHMLLLWIMPELWGLLLLIFGFALFAGWLRIRSGSILGPWLIHAVVNVTTCLSVAIRTTG